MIRSTTVKADFIVSFPALSLLELTVYATKELSRAALNKQSVHFISLTKLKADDPSKQRTLSFGVQ